MRIQRRDVIFVLFCVTVIAVMILFGPHYKPGDEVRIDRSEPTTLVTETSNDLP